ncbi:MAG TPA: hypothetical protein VGS96_11870, partial [Thermoanaerobaculia bacterium]|nr:hypothetical protein [Thermoanaerobaculia bacterium]
GRSCPNRGLVIAHQRSALIMSDSVVAKKSSTNSLYAADNPNALALPDVGKLMEAIITKGDLAQLEPQQRVDLYLGLCQSLRLNPMSMPFLYLELDKKLTLYVAKGATDQLRNIYSITSTVVNREVIGDVYAVSVRVTLPDGRSDEATGVVPLVKEDGTWENNNGKNFFKKNGKLIPLGPLEYANAIMKAETKAKRRATLSAVGLPFIDESELDTVPRARRINVDKDTGEILSDVIEGEGHVVETGPPPQKATAKAKAKDAPRPEDDSGPASTSTAEGPETQKLRKLAAARMISDTELNALTYFKFPENRSPLTLTVKQTQELQKIVETIDDFEFGEQARDYFAEIEDATTLDDLKDKVGYAMKEAGITGNTHRMLFDAYVARGKALKAQAAA